ncbi:MAG: hypothetical protein HFJ64_03885 [Eggerthellaceae bacterium]|nr:hypothetical protein [Eggerthellaceae bacterium]
MSNTARKNMKQLCRLLALCLVAYLTSGTLADYLRMQPVPLVHIILFLFTILSSKTIIARRSDVSKRAFICFLVFSLLFSISLILGYHIVTSDNLYFGTAAENYISSYDLRDVIAFLLVLLNVFSLALGVFLALTSFLQSKAGHQKLHTNTAGKHAIAKNDDMSSPRFSFAPIKLKSIILLALFIFIAYTPYFLVYCPGLSFGDSFHSIEQALGREAWNNHHPVVYSFFIKCCIAVSNFCGLGLGGGRALYTVFQMAFMAICFAYMIRWISIRCDLHQLWTVVLTLVFACTPYIASYSIAMWKDPAFSISIMMLSLLMTDLIGSKGKAVTRRTWLCAFIAFSLVATFLRSNGVFVIAIIGVITLLLFVKYRKQNLDSQNSRSYLRVSLSSLTAVLLYVVITGPLYSAIGILPAPKVEGYGLFLNQMARVVVEDGSMAETDKAYMNDILPLDRYDELYTPCCIDQLKWSEGFNNEALEDGFLEHWVSMFIQNPRAYFEEWELETFGFWTVNQPTINKYSTNIASGVPGSYRNILGIDQLQDVFPLNTWSIPTGWILWLVLYLIAFLISIRKTLWVVTLMPTLGLVATLIIASPICYWPRYAAATQFLIPFYLAILLLALRDKNNVIEINN